MFINLIKTICLASLVSCVGCASIVNGTSQELNVITTPVSGANCQISNSRGVWSVKSPGSAMVHRAYGPASVSCRKDSYFGHKTVQSHTKPMAFGNVIVGGIPGAVIDSANGAAYDYPSQIVVPMSKKP